MHKLRCILAFLFAILVAGPACCCFASPPVQQADHACCGGEQEKKESICNCGTAISQKLTDDIDVPPALASSAPPPAVLEIKTAIFQTDIQRVPAVYVDTGPPRLRLAMLQRFLI